MSAQPEQAPDPRVRPIPHTINAIGDALSAEKRLAFYAEVLAAEEGEPINTVMRKWWMEAMFDRRPGRRGDEDASVVAQWLHFVPAPMRRRSPAPSFSHAVKRRC